MHFNFANKVTPTYEVEMGGVHYLSTYLNNGNIMFWLQLSDVVLELDNDFDQVHDGFVDSVIGAVELSRGCSLDRIKNISKLF